MLNYAELKSSNFLSTGNLSFIAGQVSALVPFVLEKCPPSQLQLSSTKN